jgi:hypothetical protein
MGMLDTLASYIPFISPKEQKFVAPSKIKSKPMVAMIKRVESSSGKYIKLSRSNIARLGVTKEGNNPVTINGKIAGKMVVNSEDGKFRFNQTSVVSLRKHEKNEVRINGKQGGWFVHSPYEGRQVYVPRGQFSRADSLNQETLRRDALAPKPEIHFAILE